MDQFSGRVVKRAVGGTSKSARAAVCLDTGAKQFILRRRQGNPFQDDELEKLVGKEIRADGSLIGGATLVMSDWSELPGAAVQPTSEPPIAP